MTHGPHYRVPFRRRREGRTDYRVRSKLLRSGKPRVVVRKTLNQTIVQFISPDVAGGDRVLVTAQSLELKEHGWSSGTGNLPAAYLTGFLAGRRAASQGLKEAVLDLGRQRPAQGGRLFAALQGLLDSGVAVPHSADVLPGKERLRGAHIGEAVTKQFDLVKSKLEAT
jgi:large subunit ribosomal protein L18